MPDKKPLWKTRRFRLLLIAIGFLYLYAAGRIENSRVERQRDSYVPGSGKFSFSIDTDSLFRDVQALSAPEMEGRRTGTDGSRRAQKYILDRLRDLSVTPFQGSYEKKFSFTRYSIRGLVSPSRKFKTEYPDATNLIAEIRGRKYPDRYLALSAHYDHMGIRNGKLYPGADDNASGVASVLAAAQYFSMHQPEHSLLLLFFDAEEQGNKGSGQFWKDAPVDPKNVVLNVNLDMVSKNDRNEIFVCGTYQTPELEPAIRQVALASPVKLLLGHDRPLYLAGFYESWLSSSDHHPFHQKGIPILYFGVEDHEDYHRPTDSAAGIPRDFYAAVTKSVIETLRYFDSHPPQPRD